MGVENRLPEWLNGKSVVRTALAVIALLSFLRVGFGAGPWDTEVAAKHAARKVASLDDYMVYGFWYGALFTGSAAFVLLLTSRWWLDCRTPSKIEIVRPEQDTIAWDRFLKVLLIIVCVAAIPRVARMGQPFWGDEDWAYRDLIGGRYRETEDGSLKFKRHPWKVTAFWDKGTNNQYAYTLVARGLHDSWKRISGARPEVFSEAVLRVPSLLAGLGSIAMGALLLRRMGYSRGGLLLAALMALHPWHLRYSSEARGYTMLIFFLLAGIYFLIAALEDGRWRWWVLFALCEFLSLYTWKAAIHPIAALNLGIFVMLLVKRRGDVAQFARWLVVNIAVLMVFVPLFAPAIPQIKRKLEVSFQAHGKMELQWFKDVTAQLAGGADWMVLHGWALGLALFGLVFLVLGLRRLGEDRGLAWILITAPIFGAVLAFAHFAITGNELLKWYVFYLLPFLLIPIAIGLERKGALRYGFFALFLGLSVWTGFTRVTAPIQDSRAVAAVTRNDDEGFLHMGSSEIVTVGMFRVAWSYDPRIRQGRDLRSGEALMEVVEECRASGKKLRVSAANLGLARTAHKDFFEVLENPEIFRKTGDFPAAEPYIEMVTYEMVR